MSEKAVMRRVAALALASCTWLLHDIPITAQPGSGFELARTSFTSVHQYVAAEAIPTQLASPSNIVVSPMYRQVVEAMLRGSPTFRRQCLRLAAEPALTVILDMNPHEQRSDLRAKTHMTRNAKGHLSAVVQIMPLQDIEELIAHEFEHIIEQLDDVDLAEKARRARSGVHAIESAGVKFETRRALQVGLRVVREFRQTAGHGS